MAPKKQTDWTIFLTNYRTEHKGTADFMSSAAEAYGKLTAAQKKAAGTGSLTSDWGKFLYEFRTKNKDKFGAADMMSNAGEAWKEMSDDQKAVYGPKKNAAKKDATKKDAAKK